MGPSLKSKGSRNQPVVLLPSLGGPGYLCLAAPHQKGLGLIRTFAGHGPLPLTNPPCSAEVCKYSSETRSGSRNGKVTLLPQKPCRGPPWLISISPAGEHGRCPYLQGCSKMLPRAPPSELPSSTFSWTCNLRTAPSRALSLSLCSSTMFSLPPQPGKWGVKKISQDPQFKIKVRSFSLPFFTT